MVRTASCSCGKLTVTCHGEPLRVTVCHCLACQRRTGSAFGVQARFAADRVVATPSASWTRIADSGQPVTMNFCATCGSTVWWELGGLPGFVGVAVGAFAEPGFPAPSVSIYEERRHTWCTIEGVERYD